MSAQLTVELSDLKGWSSQVGRAGDDCTGLASYVSANMPDGDFGKILSLIQGDYESMVTTIHSALVTDGQRLGRTEGSLAASARHFAHIDSQVAQRFGIGARITDDGSAGAFHDSGTTTAAAPSSGGEQLPEVDFGWVLDKVCELISWVGGPDLRATVTDWIAGDVGKASRQASAWTNAGLAMNAIEGNLARGAGAIHRTWQGDAATSASAYMDQWTTSLKQQSKNMTKMAGYLRDMIRQAVDMAQEVVDIVKEIVSLVMAGWSMASIPIYGEIKLVNKVKDGIKLLNDARKVITVFWNALKMIKDGIIMVADYFTADSLPPAPSVPA